MDDVPAPAGTSRGASATGRRFRPRQLDVGDGSRLVLHADGTIDHVGETGEALGSWAIDDPDWARHALRFGLRPQPATVAPHDGVKPPRW